MKTARITILAIACSLAAHADFSYTQTRKSAGGMAAAAMQGQNPTTKHYIKGQKMKMDMGNSATIIDMDAQTITHVNNTDKTYTVIKFSEVGQTVKDTGMDVQIDVKETGQRKKVNGYDANQVMMTMAMESPQAQGMKMQMEIEMWLSKDVPGADETRNFYRRNGDKMPWTAMAAGNPQLQKSMAAMQRKIASIGGVPVQQIVRMKSGGAPGPGPNDAQMQQAMAQLEAMKKAGGAQAQAAEQAMARMGAMRGMSGGGSLFEMTMESSDFSTASIPDSVFSVPAGYTKK
jgi:hypothetical protein